jgi:hypothetical protein
MDTVGALSSPVLLISTSRIQGEKKLESGFFLGKQLGKEEELV